MLQVLATEKRASAYGDHSVGDDNAGEILTIHKRIGKNLPGSCGNLQVTVTVNQFFE